MTGSHFTIAVPEAEVADLQQRLRHTRWPALADLPDTPYGIGHAWLREFCDYWASDYDWYAVQARLNDGDQRIFDLGGVGVHAQVWRSQENDAVPLVLTHGWPSTFHEMGRLAEQLIRRDPVTGTAFHVVAPSLPGFGFSPEPGAPHGPLEIAQLWCRLMTVLGFDRFAAHGGDFGAAVTGALAAIAPDRLIGIHLTAATGTRPERALTTAESDWLGRNTVWRDRDWGYLHLQRTRPDTAAIALTDSPAGLAGWILDRWWNWADLAPGQALDDVIDREDLATLASIYWYTGTIGSSMRMYRHTFGPGEPPGAFSNIGFRIDVPTSIAEFREPIVPPRSVLEPHFALRHYTHMPRGGHFPALESTTDLACELRTAFTFARVRP